MAFLPLSHERSVLLPHNIFQSSTFAFIVYSLLFLRYILNHMDLLRRYKHRFADLRQHLANNAANFGARGVCLMVVHLKP